MQNRGVLVQGAAAPFEGTVAGHRRIEPGELGLQLLIDSSKALSAPRTSPSQLATISSMAISFGLKLIILSTSVLEYPRTILGES